MSSAKRINWGKNYSNIPSVDLLEVQKESWKEFLEKDLIETIRSISPISDYTSSNWLLELGEVTFDEITITPETAKTKGLNYTVPVVVKAKLTNKRTGLVKEESVFLLNLPTMTPEATFIVNGIERGIINQLVRSPGVYFTAQVDHATGKNLCNAEIRPVRGSWLEFFVGKKDVIFARIDRKKKVPATVLLRALTGYTDKQIIGELGEYINNTISADPTKTKEEALLEFYRKMRPGEPVVLENSEKFFNDRFFDLRTYELGFVGRHKVNKKFGFKFDDTNRENWVLKSEDFIATLRSHGR